MTPLWGLEGSPTGEQLQLAYFLASAVALIVAVYHALGCVVHWRDLTDRKPLRESLGRIEGYVHESVHGLRNSMQTLTNRVIVLEQEVKFIERISQKTDRNTEVLTRLQAILERQFGPKAGGPR